MTQEDAASLPARLKALGIRPRRHRGQNFLVSPAILQQIVEAAELTPEDWAIEVGPGPGNLTRLLAEAAGRVIAVEVDPQLLDILREDLQGYENVSPILGDVRDLTPAELLRAGGDSEATHPYKVVANLPYYLTSLILRHFLEAAPAPRLMVVTVQWEVAQRIVARPPRMSLLSVAIQFYGEPEVVRKVPAGAFYPRPKVDSAIVRIRVKGSSAWPHSHPRAYFRVVAGGFAHRRKQLRNALSRSLGIPVPVVLGALEQAQIAPTHRAESLNLEEWARLTDALLLGHDEGDGMPAGVR